jgi:hypothetical protein
MASTESDARRVGEPVETRAEQSQERPCGACGLLIQVWVSGCPACEPEREIAEWEGQDWGEE